MIRGLHRKGFIGRTVNKKESHDFEGKWVSRPVEGTIRHSGAWWPLCNKTSLLSHDAHENFLCVALHFAKLGQGCITLATGLGERCRALRVEIPAVARCIAEGVYGSINGSVGSVIFLPEVFTAGAVEVDGWGNGSHSINR